MAFLAFRRARGGEFVSALINLFTGLRGFSHVELVFTDGVSFSSDMDDGGTRFKRIDYGGLRDGWELRPLSLSPEGEAAARAFCTAEAGRPYDYFGALSVAFPWHRQHADKWFCSEVCTAALQRAGRLAGVTPHKVSPNRLRQIMEG